MLKELSPWLAGQHPVALHTLYYEDAHTEWLKRKIAVRTLELLSSIEGLLEPQLILDLIEAYTYFDDALTRFTTLKRSAAVD